MTKYQYVAPNGEFYQGLPMVDLDSADLTDEQIALLAVATERGYYKTVGDLIADGETAKAQSLTLADLATGSQVSGAGTDDNTSKRNTKPQANKSDD